MLRLPVSKNGNSSLRVPLDGQVFVLKYNYNVRNKRLYLSILKDGETLVSSMRLVEDNLPLYNYSIAELVDYQIAVTKNKEGTGFVTLGNIGLDSEFILLFLTPDDILEILEIV